MTKARRQIVHEVHGGLHGAHAIVCGIAGGAGRADSVQLLPGDGRVARLPREGYQETINKLIGYLRLELDDLPDDDDQGDEGDDL